MNTEPLHQYVRDIEFSVNTGLQEIREIANSAIQRARMYKNGFSNTATIPPNFNETFSNATIPPFFNATLERSEPKIVGQTKSPSIFDLKPPSVKAIAPKMVSFQNPVQANQSLNTPIFNSPSSEELEIRISTSSTADSFSSTQSFTTPVLNTQMTSNAAQDWIICTANESGKDTELQERMETYFSDKMRPGATPGRTGLHEIKEQHVYSKF